MKNQDPTANTDPNEYINQLVQVNSLEQLISINQTLTTDSTATPGTGRQTDERTAGILESYAASLVEAISASPQTIRRHSASRSR